jgi:hypothetical protein
MSSRPARRRLSVAALTCAGLTLSAGALAAGTPGAVAAPTAPSADPVADCAEPFPVAEVAKGDLVDGLTVVSGTTPEAFTGEVLGVLEDGIAPDIDMIMIDLDMDAFDQTGGVWQGMSGSPVYAADGRLIGAVAYGLSWGASPIAGITPFELMDDYLTETPAPVTRLDASQARVVAKRAGITQQQAAQGFRELPMPLGVAGLSARRLAQAQDKGPDYLQKNTYVMGRADSGADAPGAETIIAGGNLAASASYGDITFAGVGTATSVCNGEVVGFGHPLFLEGTTTEGLHSADALYVQPDSLGSPFKVANIGPVLGTITEDRLTGISGPFGPAPEASTVTSTVTQGDKSRTGSTDVTVGAALPDVTFYQLLTNSDLVLGGSAEGTSLQGWTVTGDDNGTPFELSFTDRYTGGDLIYDPIFQLADLTYALAYIDGVTVDDITADNTVTDEDDTFRLGIVQQKVGSQWTRVSGSTPVRVKPGGTVRLRLLLSGSAGKATIPVPAIKIPKKASGRAQLSVQGGNNFYSYFYGRSVRALQKRIDKAVRHDEIVVTLGTRGGRRGGGHYSEDVFFRGGKPKEPQESKPFSRSTTLGPVDHVVEGYKSIAVKIRK